MQKHWRGRKKGSKDKDGIAKLTRAVDVGWQPTPPSSNRVEPPQP